jgi:DNA polymerase III subunit epsilon
MKYRHIPEFLLGFDTETTGLDVATERAISYGFCAYHWGVPVWSEHVFVVPDRPIAPAAAAVHGLSIEALENMRETETVLTVEAGVTHCVKVLREWHEKGAYIVGANVWKFDLEMLRQTSLSTLQESLQGPDFNIELLRVIDVIEHDWIIEPERDVRPRRGLERLCNHYGVTPGGHDALADARATIEVLLKQIAFNAHGQTSLLGPELIEAPSS